MIDAAYYLSWISERRKPIVARLSHQDEHDEWRILLEWNVYRMGSGRRRMMSAILQDLLHDADPAWVGHLHTTFEHHHRITVTELRAVLADGIPTRLF